MAERLITETDILYFPFNSEEDGAGNPDRLYDAQDWASYFKQFISNGVYPNPSTGLQVQSQYGSLVLTVRQGAAFVEGCFYLQKKDVDFAIDAADLVLARKDIVIVRLDRVNRLISVLYQPGTPAATPLPPALVRTDDVWDLKLCEINVNANAQQITNANIADTRLDNTVCGIVHGVVNQVDTSTIYQQYYTWFQETQAYNTTTFSAFMASINKTFGDFMIDSNAQWTQFAAAFAAWQNTFQQDARTEFDAFIAANQHAFDVWWDGIKEILNESIAAVLTQRLIILEGDFGNWSARVGQDVTTVFDPDGSIATSAMQGAESKGALGTVFNADGSISEQVYIAGATKTLTKTTVFDPDGKIREVIR